MGRGGKGVGRLRGKSPIESEASFEKEMVIAWRHVRGGGGDMWLERRSGGSRREARDVVAAAFVSPVALATAGAR